MMKIKSCAAILQLLTKQTNYFCVNNYMKIYKPNNITRHHGYFKVDQYNFYDNDENEVNKFIKREKQLYVKQSQKWKHITEEYYQISSSRRDSRVTTIPQIYDQYQYYTKVSWKNGKEYSIIYRRPLDNPAKQEIVLDIMQYSQINRYYKTVQLLHTSFSPSHRYVAFGVDIRNNQKISFLIADTKHPKKQLRKIKSGGDQYQTKLQETNDLIFASQNQIYFTKSQNFRPNRLFYQNIESGQVVEVLAEDDPQYYLGIRVTKDRKFLIVSGNSKVKTKIWLIDLNSAKRQIVKVWQDSNKVYLNHVQNHFIVWLQGESDVIKLIEDSQFVLRLKNKSSSTKQLFIKSLNSTVIYNCLEQESVEDVDIVKENIILYINHINKPILKIINYTPAQPNQKNQKFKVTTFNANLPYQFGTISPGTNQNYLSQSIIFNVSTPFIYDQIYSYSIVDKNFTNLQKYQHTGPSIPHHKYEIKHVNVPSTTMDYIPLTIIGPKKRSVGKMVINLYGFYGISNKIAYDNVTIAALEKGWTVAYAHIRGGGEKGKKWHSQALGVNRDRTWKDLEECIGYLIKEEYTHPSLLFISTSSAGAIAAWNAINRKPHLYKGAILRFPFLDVLNSLMDKSQPLSNADYQQFGNPIENKIAYKTISTISPYQNIGIKQYPAIHIVAGKNDYRTPISQIAKFACRFRDKALENNRFSSLGEKGLTVDISSTASHLGQASIKDQTYKGCDLFGYMDYVINHISNDCNIDQK